MTTVHAEPDSKLGRLCAAYSMAKPRADEAAKQLEQIVDAIKVELANATTAGPELATTVDLVADVLERPLRLHRKESWYLDAKRMKTEDPLLYVTWAKKRVVWELRQVTS